MLAGGWCLTGWSDFFSSYVSLVVSENRERVVAVAGRFALLGNDLQIVGCPSVEDDDVEAVLRTLDPPAGAFVAHGPDDPNA